MREYRHLIGGALETSPSCFDVINRVLGEPFTTCPDATQAQLDHAVSAARRAFPGWSGLSFSERRAALRRFGHAVVERIDTIALTLVREQGRPLAQARFEVNGFAEHL